MSWIGVVTNAGDALLAQWAGGSETLYITKATVGSGYVAEANMRTATELQSEKDTAAIVENKAVGNYGRKLRLRVGPNDTAGYTAHEIGLWGKLGANGTETLIQLHQDDDEGVPVPKSSESPEFVFDLIAVLATSNTASLTVNLDSSVYVTELQLEETETELGFNPDVMKAAIMAVSGVTHVLIRLNRSNTTVDGIPAGKINVLVSGGAKASICQAIYDTNTSGLETYGTLSAEISGETISFSRVTLMPVHVRVQLQGLEEPDITDVATDIKHNIFQYINYTLNVGESLEVSKIRDLVNDGLGSITGNIEIMDIYISGAHGISRGIIPTEWNKKFTLTATTEIELSTTTTATSDAIAKLDSNSNLTNDILADALNCTKTTFYNGSGSSYTGTVPNNNSGYKYGTFIVNVRDSRKYVTAVASNGFVAINTYTGSVWNGWEELVLNSKIENLGVADVSATKTIDLRCHNIVGVADDTTRFAFFIPFPFVAKNTNYSITFNVIGVDGIGNVTSKTSIATNGKFVNGCSCIVSNITTTYGKAYLLTTVHITVTFA